MIGDDFLSQCRPLDRETGGERERKVIFVDLFFSLSLSLSLSSLFLSPPPGIVIYFGKKRARFSLLFLSQSRSIHIDTM